MTVCDTIGRPLVIHDIVSSSEEKEKEKAVVEVLESVGLGDQK